MINIDYRDSSPIYEQIVRGYKNLIVRGALPPNEKMPSVRSLAMELSINPNTIQKAFSALERDGFIYTVKGKGSFVADGKDLKMQKENEIRERLDEVVKEARESGVPLSFLIDHIKEVEKNDIDK
jgi:GntR family transcriptional regulator